MVRMHFRPFALFAIAASVCAAAILGIDFSIVLRHNGLAYDVGWSAEGRGGNFYVISVDRSGPAGGKLVAGDRVLSINGDTRVKHARPDLKLRFLPTDREYTVRVDRNGAEREVSLRFVPAAPAVIRTRPEFDLRTGSRSVLDLVVFTIVALAYLLIGLALAITNPDRIVARLAFVSAYAVVFQMLGLEMIAVILGLRGWELTFGAITIFLLSPFHFALAYDFISRFPSGDSPGGIWSRARTVFYVYAIPDAIVFTLVRLLSNSNEDWALNSYLRFRLIFDVWTNSSSVRLPIYAFICLSMLAALIRNYVKETDADRRRRLKWAIAGMTAGIAPMAFLSVVLGPGRKFVAADEAMVSIGNFCTIAVPASLAYAIARHRVLGISVAMRRGLQYLLARNALRALSLIPAAVIAVEVAIHPERPVAEVLFRHSPLFYAFVALTAALLRYRKQVFSWLDRKFFREAYDQERILLELLDSIKQVEDLPSIARLVSDRIDAALHPRRVMVFYRENGAAALTLGHSSDPELRAIRINDDEPVARLLQGGNGPLDVTESDGNRVPEGDLEWLRDLQAALAVPIVAAGGRVEGALILGEKKSEEPYTKGDRRLLEAIAAQIAVVYENVALRDRVARDHMMQTEVLARLDDQRIVLLKECPACGACFDSSQARCTEDGTELTFSLPVQRTLEGKYRLERLLGKGGMGAVYAATDLRLGRAVAVKIMMGSFFGNQAALRRFDREAQACARLAHPNIISIYDFGRIGGAGAFLVMELAAGRTMREELKLRKVLDSGAAADWFEQVLEGVKAAHTAGVIHRDLKPENILIEECSGGARIKILDFGLAKVAAEEAGETRLTASGIVVGTFGYMAPEQIIGGHVDERSDIFALGIMAAEALTGERPFKGATYEEMLVATFRGGARLRGNSREVRALDAILQRCLATDPSGRYQSVAELQRDLIPALRTCPLIETTATANG